MRQAFKHYGFHLGTFVGEDETAVDVLAWHKLAGEKLEPTNELMCLHGTSGFQRSAQTVPSVFGYRKRNFYCGVYAVLVKAIEERRFALTGESSVCPCELPGYFNCGIKGIRAHIDSGTGKLAKWCPAEACQICSSSLSKATITGLLQEHDLLDKPKSKRTYTTTATTGRPRSMNEWRAGIDLPPGLQPEPVMQYAPPDPDPAPDWPELDRAIRAAEDAIIRENRPVVPPPPQHRIFPDIQAVAAWRFLVEGAPDVPPPPPPVPPVIDPVIDEAVLEEEWRRFCEQHGYEPLAPERPANWRNDDL